jgi:protein gp37
MGENSAIAWTDHTFNPWWGCARVSPGCEHCYAETLATVRRKLDVWGVDAERKPMSDAYWREPLKWNRKAEAEGARRRVFCASMADVFETPPERNVQARKVQEGARARLWPLIESTPWLDWLLLTKRPENVAKIAPWRALIAEGRYDDRPEWPRNVWIGTTVEDQKRAEQRIPWLVEIPAAVRFVSVEPQIEPVDLENVTPYYLKRGMTGSPYEPMVLIDALRGHVKGPDDLLDFKIDWVIVGGESGSKARRFDIEWARRIIDACRGAGVPVFMKQVGSRPRLDSGAAFWEHAARDMGRKGDNPELWPFDLRVQEVPR